MRKYFLLILYFAGLLFLQPGLKADSAAIHKGISNYKQSDATAPLQITDCCNSYGAILEQGVEDDDNAKPKLLVEAVPARLVVDFNYPAHDNFQNDIFLRPWFPVDLFKLIRVFRL